MTHSSFETSASHIITCSRVRPMDHATSEHLARLIREKAEYPEGLSNPCNLGGSRTSNVWLGEPRLCATRP
jgi:hypothetical protein